MKPSMSFFSNVFLPEEMWSGANLPQFGKSTNALHRAFAGVFGATCQLDKSGGSRSLVAPGSLGRNCMCSDRGSCGGLRDNCSCSCERKHAATEANSPSGYASRYPWFSVGIQDGPDSHVSTNRVGSSLPGTSDATPFGDDPHWHATADPLRIRELYVTPETGKTCAEASEEVASMSGGGTCEERKAKCGQNIQLLMWGIKCVCVTKWRLLPKGKAMTVGAVGSFNVDASVGDAAPGDDCSKNPRLTYEARNVFFDQNAGCKCVCYSSLHGDPSYPGTQCAPKNSLPPLSKTEDKGSMWNWDAYGMKR